MSSVDDADVDRSTGYMSGSAGSGSSYDSVGDEDSSDNVLGRRGDAA